MNHVMINTFFEDVKFEKGVLHYDGRTDEVYTRVWSWKGTKSPFLVIELRHLLVENVLDYLDKLGYFSIIGKDVLLFKYKNAGEPKYIPYIVINGQNKVDLIMDSNEVETIICDKVLMVSDEIFCNYCWRQENGSL